MSSYIPILLMIVFAFGFGCIMMLLGWLLGRLLKTNRPSPEKGLPYECGFDAREDTRSTFNVRYYLVAILFLLFDLELVFLLPWAIVFQDISSAAFWAMLGFLAILTVGFVYEWRRGALEWD